MEFEWDESKADANVRKHGISFAEAALSFRDPFAIEWIDTEALEEERIILLGMSGARILVVVYTERDHRYRIISARKATRYEQDIYYRENAP
jgi:uncharacterized protein